MDEADFWSILRERGDRYCALVQVPDSLIVRLVNAANPQEVLLEIPLNRVRSSSGLLRKVLKKLAQHPSSDLKIPL